MFFLYWQLLTWFVFSWRPHVIVLILSCGWMVLLLAPLLNTELFEENQMKAIQKLRSSTTQLENCLSGALELEHLEPPEDMVMDPARAKFQALGSASPKAGCAQVLNFYRTVSSLRAIRWRCPHVPKWQNSLQMSSVISTREISLPRFDSEMQLQAQGGHCRKIWHSTRKRKWKGHKKCTFEKTPSKSTAMKLHISVTTVISPHPS